MTEFQAKAGFVLFGTFRMTVDGAPFRFAAPPKTLPLLAYLLLHAGPARRDRLAFMLWPDSTDVEARTDLRRHLYYLQRALPPAGSEPWFRVDAQTVTWNPTAACSIDVKRFVALSASDETRAEAAALYAGDLLEDVLTEEWLLEERERLRNLQLSNLSALVLRSRIARDYPAALRYAEQIRGIDPWREDAIRQVMGLRNDLGDRAGALAEFDRFAARLRAEMATEPMPETLAVYEAILDETAPYGLDPPDDAGRGAPRAASRALPFVGRDDEFVVLRAAWGRAARGRGSTLLIGGEAGIGKTRLVDALATTVTAEAGRVLWGQTGSVETSPYQAALDAVRAGARFLAESGLDEVWLAAAGTLVPQVYSWHPHLPVLPKITPEHEQSRLFETFTRAFKGIARSRPLLVVLEDLHWAGAASIALLEHLVRALANRPILIAGTYREEEIARDHPLRAFRRRAAHERLVKNLPLGPLCLEAVEQLIARRNDDGTAAGDTASLAQRLHSQSGGNPLFFGELLRSYEESDDRPPAAVSTLQATIAGRLGRLSREALTVAQFAAIIGSGFDLELLAATSGWSEAELSRAVDELVDRQIVRDGGFDDADYAFSHVLIQSAIYATIAPAEARRRHRRAGEVLAELHANRLDDVVAQLAGHFDRGGEGRRAAEYYLKAAERTLRLFAYAEAEHYASRGLELDADPTLQIGLHFAREAARQRLLDRDGQRADLDVIEALLAQREDTQERRALIKRRIALARNLDDRDAEWVGVTALRTLAAAAGHPSLSADALLAEAAYRSVRGELPQATSMFRKALPILENLGDVAGQVAAQVALVQCTYQQGQAADAARFLSEANTLAERSGDPQLRVLVTSAAIGLQLFLHDTDGVVSSAHELVRLASAIGDAEEVATANMRLGAAHMYRFEVSEAREHLAYARRFFETHRNAARLRRISFYEGLLHCIVGRTEEGLTALAGAAALTTTLAASERSAFIATGAYFKVEAGRAREARDELVDLLHELKPAPLAARIVPIANLGIALRELGELDAAIEKLEFVVEWSRSNEPTDRLNLCGDLHELAIAYLRAGQIERACKIAEEYLALMARGTESLVIPHHMYFVAAQCFRASGDRARALELLERAGAELDRMVARLPDAATRETFLALTMNRELSRARANPGWAVETEDVTERRPLA